MPSASYFNLNNSPISVSELNRQVRTLLEQNFLSLHVEGEISNFVCPASGHWYFTLKDANAQIRCAMFKGSNIRIARPAQGDKVIVRAKVSLYEGRGDYQLICDFMEPSGSGKLQAAFEQLKRKLQQEGLFDLGYKQLLPEHPTHVGIITSSTGAAIHDILKVLNRRFPSMLVSLYPSMVQGEDAPASICSAIELACKHKQADVLIIGRGGGSLEDLQAFNNEQVARAIFNSDIPVISAVGHESDVVICDFVADVRAATPSAAAEMVSPDKQQLLLWLQQIEQRLVSLFTKNIGELHARVDYLCAKLRHPESYLREQIQKLDHLHIRLCATMQQKLLTATNKHAQLITRLQSPKLLLITKNEQLDILNHRLSQALSTLLQQKKLQLEASMTQLHAISPLATLKRGYAIVKDEQGQLIYSSEQQQIGDMIEAKLHQGSLLCQIDKIIRK